MLQHHVILKRKRNRKRNRKYLNDDIAAIGPASKWVDEWLNQPISGTCTLMRERSWEKRK